MSASTPKKNTFFGGAAILAASVVLVKVIGALYKIPLGGILTDAAFADFNTAYYIYSLLIIISTGGLPVALSKMVSEAHAQNRGNQVQKVFRLAMVAFCVLGALSCAVMLLFPRQLADLMNNSHSYWSILALAPALFFICPMSALRGYFQGHSLMTPTAVSQVIEALCKLVIGLALAKMMVGAGLDESQTAGGAILGVSVGCALGMVYMFFCYGRFRLSLPKFRDKPDESDKILSTLTKLAIPITLGSSVMAVVNLLDSSIIMGRLQDAAGFTEEAARTLKGIYDKAMTLYNLPASFMVPLTASVVPAVSAARATKNYRQAAQVSETALRTTALLALPAGAGLFVLGEPIIKLLYPSTDVALAGWMLSMLGLASICVCVMLVCNSIMQAHRLVSIPVLTTAIGCVLKIIINFILVGKPDINIQGGPIGTLVCFGVIAILDLVIIKLALPRSLSYVRVFAKPAAATAAMGASVWAVYGLASKLLVKLAAFQAVDENGSALLDEAGAAILSWKGNALSVIAAIGVGVIVYFALVLVTHAISREDLALMPKGDKIARLLRIP